MALCFSCGAQLDFVDKPGRAETCAACGADVHCCCNCAFYDPGSYNECRETQAERVLVKERSNFCDYFAFRRGTGDHTGVKQAAGSRTNPLDDLFKK